ncbi:hypothetical protein CHU94_00440 [Rhodoferax sp. TH121]|uniref:DUF4390 domain-containing protein n=1 Tax=Rhodoferax sp. TH121 TaxID=2022803 RepID=UPI000B9670BF|nr:DUF4390 domain-containing protein [Rhodoferax sp. TH121]OYQ43088.1 hypothetical protein CHU94_00440 [Rhodoferax sp. TH121]
MRWLAAICFLGFCLLGRAQGAAEIVSFELERGAEELSLSAQLQFEPSVAVEEALLKGIPMVFVAETELLRERWYWYDKSVASSARHFRLAFQPLTRRWRLNISSGPVSSTGQGLVLNQSFDTLQQALATIKRVSRWRVAGANELDPTVRYRFEFRFRLDLGQLPRPFQIGAIGQSEWDISVGRSELLAPEAAK